MIQGHRTYIDNPKLVTTHARKPPLARFHRRWMDGPTPDREIWAPIPGFVGRYEVSNFGAIRSLLFRSPRIRRTYPDADGYPRVSLFTKEGSRKDPRVHRIVAEVFLADQRSVLHNEVAHLDGTRTNCRLSNLKWVSKVENCSHKIPHGSHQAGEKHPRAKLTRSQVEEIHAAPNGAPYRALAERYGVSRHTISDIRRGRRWSCRSREPDYVQKVSQ